MINPNKLTTLCSGIKKMWQQSSNQMYKTSNQFVSVTVSRYLILSGGSALFKQTQFISLSYYHNLSKRNCPPIIGRSRWPCNSPTHRVHLSDITLNGRRHSLASSRKEIYRFSEVLNCCLCILILQRTRGKPAQLHRLCVVLWFKLHPAR